jgi:uncharacterized protein (DUF2235 family)
VLARTDAMTTQTHADAGTTTAASAAGKSIVLFSDGTGNSSAQLFKTNVWRMYEAVDLGPPAPGKRPQISYYDDGVGTSSFKPLAALGGAFGWGLKRNVLDIYRYVCRNYQEGDDLYAFGFSRGAFTARIVVALIAAEGLVRSETEAELERKSVAAYRAFRQRFLPRRLAWPTKIARALRRAFLSVADRIRRRIPYDSSENLRPNIRFVGVWDTVAAYGGPIAEVTRAVDNWFFPLSMPDYHLDERVLCARHALALDDERDAFHPLLWDEVHEEELITNNRVSRGRLQQVWFTGMHADVGGGYPDESLSYVSLLWMMEEAEHAGLRTLTVIKDRFLALASSFGPIHDSRAGLGAYYRYQPRKLAAWVDPVDDQTLSLRDPSIADATGRSRGLLQSVVVHETVLHRIATGTDRYAPINLPRTFRVIPPQEQGENAPQADSDATVPPRKSTIPRPMLDTRIVARVTDATAAAARDRASEAIWNRVWWRRITYFATLTATLLLLLLPVFVERLPTPPILSDGRTWIGGVIRLLTIVLPAWAGQWVEVYADNPFYFLLFGGIIVALLAAGQWMERRLRDESRRLWHAWLNGDLPNARQSWVQRFRNSRAYQRTFQLFKWYVLPDWVISPLTIVVLCWILFAAYVQAALPFLENGTAFCRPSSAAPREIDRVSGDFSPRDVCSGSFGWVKEGNRYVVTFDVLDPWYDASLAATPEGLAASEFPAGLGYIAGPLKRVLNARYLQPVMEIRPTENEREESGGNVQIYPLEVRQVGDSRTLFRADFRAPRGGELFLFVNDAMLPFTGGKFDYRYFYERSGSGDAAGNRGSACVTVESVETEHLGPTMPIPGSVCEQTGLRGGNQARIGSQQVDELLLR